MRKSNHDRRSPSTIISLLIDMIFLAIAILVMFFLVYFGAQ
jgi:hypothetical protein